MESRLTLIELLLAADVITLDDIAKAHAVSRFFGRQPGALLANLVANDKVFELALNLMTLVNSSRMRRGTAVGMLKLLFKRHKQGFNSITRHQMLNEKPQLGELLCQAGLIDSVSLASALLSCEMLKLRLGQYLVLNTELSAEIVQEALSLQQEVKGNVISFEQATNKLSEKHRCAS